MQGDPARAAVFAFIAEHTRPGDPIYVGVLDHRFIFVNEMDLYFLSERTGSTRYMQFDPNIVNREDVQRTMVAELERVQPKVAILSFRFGRSDEPNQSRNMGSQLLDDYLRQRYEIVGRSGAYMLALRRP